MLKTVKFKSGEKRLVNSELIPLLETRLEDDGTAEGGIAFPNEQLQDFLFVTNTFECSLHDVNILLKFCGVKQLERVGVRRVR